MKKVLAILLGILLTLSAFSFEAYAQQMSDKAAGKDGYVAYDYTPGKANEGIMDFSYLNEMPAGQHGAVTVKDGDFVFEDGTPVRFWGVNMGFGCATPEKEVAEAMAAELASSGVNFVRLHAIDCTYSGILNFSYYQVGEPTGDIVESQLDKMDYLIYCLKEKGIYIHLDTNAGRVLSTGDGFTADEVKFLQSGTLRGYHVFVERIAQKELEYVKELLGHQNPYTGMKYCEDPVIAVVQLMNESSVLWLQNYGEDNSLTEQLRLDFNEWLVKKYGTRENMAEAWTNLEGKCFLLSDEDPTKGTVRRGLLGAWSEPGINVNSTDLVNSPIRYAEFMSFLIDLQTGVFMRFYNTLREMGYKGSINCSNYPIGPIDLYMNSYGDVTEKNTYYNFSDQYELPATFSQSVMSYENPATTTGHLASQMTWGAVADKATVITEWAVCSPGEFKADAVFQVACYAAFQDWDGFCMFNYSFDGFKTFFNRRSYTDFFAFHMDPSAYGEFGICAAIFRGGLVAEAKNTVEFVYSTEDILTNNTTLGNGMGNQAVFVSKFRYRFIDGVYNGNADLVVSSGNTVGADYTSARYFLLQGNGNRYTTAMQKVDGMDAWLSDYAEGNAVEKYFGGVKTMVGTKNALLHGVVNQSNSAGLLTDILRHFGLIGADKGFNGNTVVSDTGELKIDGNKHQFTAETDKVVVITGEPHGTVKSGDVTLNTTNDLAAIAVLAMDGKDIDNAERLFIYTIGRSCASNEKWTGNKITSLGDPPMVYEDIKGTAVIRSEAENMQAWGLDPDGQRIASVAVNKVNGGFEISLGQYCFYELSTVEGSGETSEISEISESSISEISESSASEISESSASEISESSVSEISESSASEVSEPSESEISESSESEDSEPSESEVSESSISETSEPSESEISESSAPESSEASEPENSEDETDDGIKTTNWIILGAAAVIFVAGLIYFIVKRKK